MRRSDIALLIKNSDVLIANGYGERNTQPTITPEEICFNGVGRDSAECFYYPAQFEFNEKRGLPAGVSFCKTVRLPYDEVVAAYVMVIKYHLGEDVRTSSDGDRHREDEWKRALDLFSRTFPDSQIDPILP